MIPDAALMFTSFPSDPITVSGLSTNILDLGANRDLGGGGYPSPFLVAEVIRSFASATPSATLTIQLLGAPNNAGSPGGFQAMQASPPIPLGQLMGGQRLLKVGLAAVAELLLPPLTTNMTTTAGSPTATVASASGIVQGLDVFANPNVVPGTTVASVSGTIVTLSANAAASGTLVATGFGAQPLPRFLQMNFICSAMFTAGNLWSGFALDTDQYPIEPAGWSWGAGA